MVYDKIMIKSYLYIELRILFLFNSAEQQLREVNSVFFQAALEHCTVEDTAIKNNISALLLLCRATVIELRLTALNCATATLNAMTNCSELCSRYSKRCGYLQ